MRRVSKLRTLLPLFFCLSLAAQAAIAASAPPPRRRPSLPPLLKRLITIIHETLEIPKP
jgi:hypothetical protein